MRILHTSDWHLGMPLKLGTMIADQQYFLDQLYSIIEEYDVNAVICAGDIYDSSVTNAEAIELYSSAITKICKELGKKMIVISGNHDSGARLASGRELLEMAGLYVSGKIVKDTRPVSIGNADIYPIPFFNRDEVIAFYPDKKSEITSQEAATKVLCDHIRESMDPSRVNIIVSHAFITSAELSDSDRAAQVGQATSVSKDVFDGFDYVALGHIHKPQAITETIRYSGSPTLTTASQKSKDMQKLYESLSKRWEKYQVEKTIADSNTDFARKLNSSTGLSLQRYVLGVMLTSITVAANQLLKTVRGGRYQLYRRYESSGRALKAGLELDVLDTSNGEKRSVTTLSGGEKFLLALSLAIGLSTVVQAQSGGTRLDAMFIDEGFGSLDSECINDAMSILQGIQKSHGLVGIISHVEKLSEIIPTRLEVVTSADGNHIKPIIA